MMMAGWNVRNRSINYRDRKLSPEEYFRLDENKSPVENAYTIYKGLSNKKTSDSLRVCFLNEIVKLFEEHKPDSLKFTVEEWLYLFSTCLVHHQCQIRAATLRAIRHLLSHPNDLQKFNELQLAYLCCRSLDIVLFNEEERLQALKLIRKMLAVSPEHVSPVIVYCLVSLAESGTKERILRACLATLCEIGVLNPNLLIMCGGVSAIRRNVLETHSPRIAESLCGVLLHLLEYPCTRNLAGVRLECLAAPYCDITYKKQNAGDLRFTSSRIALLSVLKSFAGIIEFCNPNNTSGLKAIIEVLYLNQDEVKKAILDLFYELIGLPTPQWNDESIDYSVALGVVDPADFQDAWRITDGFVAVEGRSILPTLAHSVPNITEIHLSMLLYSFVENSLLNALVQVIVTSENALSVRATILLGRLLELMHKLLPADVCNTNHCLPTLIMKAAEGNDRAKAAIAALTSYHQMLRNRPASCSLFLDTIIQSGQLINSRIFHREISTKEAYLLPKKRATLERRRYDSVGSSSNHEDGSDNGRDGAGIGSSSSIKGTFTQKRAKFLHFFDNTKEYEKLIHDSQVLSTNNPATWDWDIVITLLRSDMLGKMDDLQTRFIRTLVSYYKPSLNLFSHEELTEKRQVPSFVTAGLDLLDWLLKSSELECIRLLTDLFTDIKTHLLAISTSRSAHNCLFSPQHMASTMCQQYFLFIGRLCKNDQGLNVLTNTDVFKQLSNLVSSTKTHICYVKLIVSGLDYSYRVPRQILEKALKSPQRAARHYATQFLLVLLRAKVPKFDEYGIPLIINQLRDKERLISLTALDILLEACHDKTYLEEIVNLWPSEELAGLEDDGRIVMTKFYSIPRGINHTKAHVKEEIQLWMDSFNKKYVLMLEADTHASLTLHTRNEDKTYSKRTCSNRPTIVPPNILPHLYGQLVQTSQGMANLQRYGLLVQHIETLENARCGNDTECLNLKASLWVLGHLSTSAEGVEFLNDPVTRVYEKIIYLAKTCPVYSIRATSINVLGLIGSTKPGADVLYKLDWLCVRHDRNTLWPVNEPEDWVSQKLSPVRHAFESFPPYNYTGIDERDLNVSGIGQASFYFDDPNDSITDIQREEIDTVDMSGVAPLQVTSTTPSVPAKARTLPDKILTARAMRSKHNRSLSESKTADSLSIINNPDIRHRQRFNSGTDSNTSGVSSCDSVGGRNAPEFTTQHHTLSPIPSSSNLMEFKRPRPRRISVTGVPINDMGPSPQDIHGVAAFRSIRRNRPVWSESAAEDHNSSTVSESQVQSTANRPFYSKSKSLDRHSSFSGYEDFKQNLLSHRLLKTSNLKGPCYIGICLPKYINDLFPPIVHNAGTYVSQLNGADSAVQLVADLSLQMTQLTTSDDVNVVAEPQITNLPNMMDSMSDVGMVSSMSDVSTTSKRCRMVSKHDRNECLYCARQRGSRLNSSSCISSDLNISASTSRKRGSYAPQSILTASMDVSYNSPESVFSEESVGTGRISNQILRHVQNMVVWSKQSKNALLELKNKQPAAFQDICLYSEVCKILGNNTYRPWARRFIQEIFYDLDFDCFFSDTTEILKTQRELFSDETLEIIETSDTSGELNVITMSKMSSLAGAAEKSNSNCSSSSSSSAIVKTHLMHFKPPALASVYEASAENLLTDSLNSKRSSLNPLSVPNKPDGDDDDDDDVTTPETLKFRTEQSIDGSSATTLTETANRNIFTTNDMCSERKQKQYFSENLVLWK
ncbi:rapamycin-insensitive companion of mTOR isoform X2 [Culicoides brevitarsis]|uniref:rapamycin-insensitive companion of mTOR isoform X2 n=1 Tax=Culicoides brevitarsis TaxID=469753 RepID=UPI00307C6340